MNVRRDLTLSSTSRRNLFAYVVLLLTMVMWGSAFSGIRYMLDVMTPMSFTMLRMMIAAATMLVVGIVRGVKLPQREDLKYVISAAILGFSGYHLLLNLGATHISAGQASFIIATTPIWTAVLAAKFLRERITMRIAGGLGISLVGVSVISLLGMDVNVSVGVIFVLFAALCDAIYTILSKGLLERYRAIDFAVYSTLIGCLPMIAYLPWAWPEVAALEMNAWMVVIYLGVVPISLGYWLSNVALSILPATRATQMMLLVPAIAAVFAWIVIDEQPGLQMLIGGPLILLGVVVGNVRGRKRSVIAADEVNTSQ